MSDGSASIDEALGYVFRDRGLVELALSHPSYAYEVDGSRGNERLEFLGDAVLDLIVGHALFEAHPDWAEGDLTRTRAALVNQDALARRARDLELGRFLKLGRTEQLSAGSDKDSILGNLLEALLGAVYLDGGFAAATALAERIFGADMAHGAPAGGRDPKTAFQEWAHARYHATPTYRTLSDSGTENDQARFTVEVRIGFENWGEGRGRSKRTAEREAAQAALDRSTNDDA